MAILDGLIQLTMAGEPFTVMPRQGRSIETVACRCLVVRTDDKVVGGRDVGQGCKFDQGKGSNYIFLTAASSPERAGNPRPTYDL